MIKLATQINLDRKLPIRLDYNFKTTKKLFKVKFHKMISKSNKILTVRIKLNLVF